jgi:hypothetical protein
MQNTEFYTQITLPLFLTVLAASPSMPNLGKYRDGFADFSLAKTGEKIYSAV